MKFLKKLGPIILSVSLFALAVWEITPPEDLSQATPLQLAAFFIPLLCFLTFLFNLYFKFLAKSLAVSLVLTLLLVFKSLDLFNFISLAGAGIALYLVIKYIKTPSKSPMQSKIPKLSQLKKQ